MDYVLDASLTLAWLFEDENHQRAESLQNLLLEASARVPQHWSLEVSNALLVAYRRKRLKVSEIPTAIKILKDFSIRVDPQTFEQAWEGTLKLASQYRLSAYDAAYLELALRDQVPLASLDKALRTAGKKAGVELL